MATTNSDNLQALPPPAAPALPSVPTFVPYEQQLSSNWDFAMDEGDRYFQDASGAHKALKRISQRLNEMQIPYAVAGGMALYRHGYRRFTEDVDILVTAEGLKRIHDELDGRGWVPPFSKSKQLRDTVHGVKVEFLVTGQFPGDGKPKPIAFPEPSSVAVDIGGIKFISLPTLVNLKLASGMTNSDRKKDLVDVEELMRAINLDANFAHSVDPFVRDEYLRIWNRLRTSVTRYVLLVTLPDGAPTPTTWDELLTIVPGQRSALEAMRQDGLLLDAEKSSPQNARLYSHDLELIRKYGMVAESDVDWQ